MNRFAEQVARGMALLDERGPTNWRKRINLNTLDVSTGEDCILGQVYGWYPDGLDALGIRDWDEVPANLGFRVMFVADAHTMNSAYAELTQTWRDALTDTEQGRES